MTPDLNLTSSTGYSAILEHFDQISEAPDAIPRLRRFILDLAVRGKLVKQDPDDEPAAELLKRIEVEKRRLEKIGLIKNGKHYESIREEELPFVVPKNWNWTKLCEITRYIQRGKSPRYSTGDGPPVISQKCIQWDGFHLEWAKSLVPESLEEYEPVRFLQDGDLLWNSTGTGTIGRVIRVNHPLEPLVCDSHVTVIRCLFVSERFICIWLRSDYVYGTIEDRATGATKQVELTASMANNQITPLPPLAEQHRIVAKVDELMKLCNELESTQQKREMRRDRLITASLSKLTDESENKNILRFSVSSACSAVSRPEHIYQLRQTILNLAVHGKLVPQNPNDEPASDLLKRIQTYKEQMIREGKIKKEKPLPSISKLSEPFRILLSWAWTRIGICSLIIEYGTSVKSAHLDDGIPVLNMGDIRGGQVILKDQKRVPGSIDDLPKLFLKHLDILYNRTNSAELVGKTGIFLGEDDKYTFASYLIRIRFVNHLTSPIYVNLAMNAPYFRESQIIPELKQQCGQANVNGTKLKNMMIPFPPLAEQQRIMEKVDELMAMCDELEANLTTTATNRQELLEATLHEALSGYSSA